MAISGSSVALADIGPPHDLAFVVVDLAAPGPNGEVSGKALAIAQVGAGGVIVTNATAANQATQITAEQAILAKLTADPATQTTLAAILAKIIAAPATAAKQPALGTAGTASADVITVQGIAAMTPFLVTPSVPVGGTYADRSIANLAGTSETLMASNASRKVLIIYNIGATALAVNLTGGTASLTVGGSTVLQAGGSLVLDTYPPTSAITIIGTANADVTAYEG